MMSQPVPYDAIVIGASAGALEALTQLLPVLPKDYAIPIITVVHLPPGKKSIFADLLKVKCKIDVHEAEDKEPVRPATAYLAPPDYHLQVEPNGFLSLSSEEPVLFSRPSIDILFETAAETYREKLIGIVLTGASSDGANGLKNILDAGGIGLVQHPEEAFASAMPEAALAKCSQAQAMSLKEIASYLLKAVTA